MWVSDIGNAMIVLWSDRKCMRSANLNICWCSQHLKMRTLILSYLRLPTWLGCKSQLWIYSDFHFKRKCCQKWKWKSQLICSSITNLHSNVCNFYSLIWLRYLSIDVFLNDNIRINTTFHFSFPFRLIFLSIDFFLNQSIHLRLTY